MCARGRASPPVSLRWVCEPHTTLCYFILIRNIKEREVRLRLRPSRVNQKGKMRLCESFSAPPVALPPPFTLLPQYPRPAAPAPPSSLRTAFNLHAPHIGTTERISQFLATLLFAIFMYVLPHQYIQCSAVQRSAVHI